MSTHPKARKGLDEVTLDEAVRSTINTGRHRLIKTMTLSKSELARLGRDVIELEEGFS